MGYIFIDQFILNEIHIHIYQVVSQMESLLLMKLAEIENCHRYTGLIIIIVVVD